MSAKCVGPPWGSSQNPAIPPGFKSLISFRLERVQDNRDAECMHEDDQSGAFDEEAFRKSLQEKPWLSMGMSLQQKPWLSIGISGDNSEGSFDPELSGHGIQMRTCLRKGVVHGDSNLQDRPKVIARWHPHEACRPTLDEAPVFYPNEEEFKDTIKYVASIRPLAESYGICRIVPPSSWKPPCPLKDKCIWENQEFSTIVQPVERLQNRFVEAHKLTSRKRQRVSNAQADHSVSDCMDFKQADKSGYYCSNKDFEFEYGPKFTFKTFEKYASDFVEQYFCPFDSNMGSKNNEDHLKRDWKPSVDDIEGEYWRIIEKPTEEIEVLYGANIETNKFSSGFPRTPTSGGCSTEDKYLNSCWNLNNTPHLPGSLLAFESGGIPGILMPLLQVGMCFSTILWHVEQHYLYSLNYLHWGAPRVCYAIPGRHAQQLEAAMKKHHSRLFAEQPHLFHERSAQPFHSLLNLEGVPVYRCVQRSGEFVLTFPRAYHCGFNCGFNCVEAVNIAPVDWLPYGQSAIETYRDRKHIVSMSYDKLLLGAAREAVRAHWNISFHNNATADDFLWRDIGGKDKILARVLKARIDIECKRRDYFGRYLKSMKIDSGLDAIMDRRCVVCLYDLHLSAVGCSCSPDKFACLNHAKKFCQCDQSMKFVLFRYTASELNTLADALGGKLSAVHKWAISDLGLSLSSRVPKPANKEQDLASEASSTNSGGGETCGNSLKKPPRDQPSRSRALLTQDQNTRKAEIVTSFETEVGLNLGSTSEKVAPQLIPVLSDAERAGHMRVNDGCRHGTPDSDKERTILEAANDPRSNAILQKGPRLAKMSETNFVVELLRHGTINSSGSWFTSRAIFPKGYRSRVSYVNVHNPSVTCYYISEILDAGIDGPLFMVQMEQCASEVFIHTSAEKCWDMVREKVNRVIKMRWSTGKPDRPHAQAPGSVDGLQMFGLTCPRITQAIEALDTNHACTEYWKSRSEKKCTSSAEAISREARDRESDSQEKGFSTTFHGLFKKANREELGLLHQILRDGQPGLRQEALKLLEDELSSCSKDVPHKSRAAI